jgi:hypothetical protein
MIFNYILVLLMRRYPRFLILLAPFFVIYISLFFALFQCYCLSDADFLGPPAIEASDLLSQPSCSLGDDKFFALSSHHIVLISDADIFKKLAVISFPISSLELTSHILRC